MPTIWHRACALKTEPAEVVQKLTLLLDILAVASPFRPRGSIHSRGHARLHPAPSQRVDDDGHTTRGGEGAAGAAEAGLSLDGGPRAAFLRRRQHLQAAPGGRLPHAKAVVRASAAPRLRSA